MGLGKTKVAIDLIEHLHANAVLVCCPRPVVDVWRVQLERHARFPFTLALLDERAGSVAQKARAARDTLALARVRRQPAIIVVNYESVWLEPFASWSLNTIWSLVVADECVPPGSLIDTPAGPVPIENLREGDAVHGYDHTTNTVVATTVTATFHRQTTTPLLPILGARLTPEHPVWTFNRGYIPARLVRDFDEVLLAPQEKENLSENLPPLPGALHGALLEGLAGTALLELGDPGRLGPGGAAHPVHNLETGTGNYFVNGLLVHNCHRLKSPSGKLSRFMGKLALRAPRRLGLTGTPIPHSPLDVWGQFRFLDRSVYDDIYHSFATRYGIFGGFERRAVVGWRDMDDFERRMASITFHAGAEELDLPPQLDEALFCDLTPSGMRLYRQLETEMIALLGTLPDEVLTVPNAMVLLLRLQQLTGGSLKDDVGRERVVDTAKERLLEEWLLDLPPAEPVVVFCKFHPDIDAVRRVCQKIERPYAEISGRDHNGIRQWAEQRNGVLMAQIQTASEGQDFTRARYAAYYSMGFSLKDYVQSRARLHRPGQTRPVAYYHLLARGTVDEIVLRAVENRWEFAETVLKELKKHAARNL